MKERGFLKGAATVAVGGLVAKLLGALYRVPLLSLVGGRGVGLYQMVYPFYCLLLTVSATGIPSALSKLGAERYFLGKSDEGVFKTALRLFSIVGGVGTVLMALLAPVLAKVQAERGLLEGYLALSPSVFLVSLISVFRGFYQGRGNMLPTAISEILEQLIKVTVGLVFAYLYRGNPEKAVRFLLFGVTVSEGVTLLWLVLLYRRKKARFTGLLEGERLRAKEVLSLSVPVTLSAAALPIAGLVESVLLVRLMRAYTSSAVSLYGLFSGGAVTLVGLPVSLCYGLATCSVPAVSAAKGEGEARKKILRALRFTLVLGGVCAALLFCFAPLCVRILFSALSTWEKETLVNLVRACALSAVTLSALQTLSACLTGLGKPKRAALSQAVGGAVRILADILFVSNPKFSVYGAAIALNLGYLVAFLLVLMYNLNSTNERRQANDYGSRSWRRRRGYHPQRTGGDSLGGEGSSAHGAHPFVCKRGFARRRARNP